MTTLARYRVHPDDVDGVLPDLLEAARATAAEPGNVYFHVLRADDDSIVLVEGWDSQESLDKHRTTEAFTSILLGRVVPQLVSREVEVLTPVYGEELA